MELGELVEVEQVLQDEHQCFLTLQLLLVLLNLADVLVEHLCGVDEETGEWGLSYGRNQSHLLLLLSIPLLILVENLL